MIHRGPPRVRLVNGQRVRDEVYTDFAMGGSDARYAFIPEGEVWVERAMTPEDRAATVVHELVERRLMLAGLAYGPAHARATAVEARFRRGEDRGLAKARRLLHTLGLLPKRRARQKHRGRP